MSLLFLLVFRRLGGALSSAEAPAGCPNKNNNNGKMESAGGMMGRGKRREGLSSLFPLPIVPRALYFSSQPPYDKKRPALQRGEWVDKNWCGVAAKAPGT